MSASRSLQTTRGLTWSSMNAFTRTSLRSVATRPSRFATISSSSSLALTAHHSITRRTCSTSSSSTGNVTSSSRICPSCSTPLPASIVPICPQCSSILRPPPSDTTSFALFNLPQSYSIDLPSLKRAFLQYQQKVHPDLFSGQGEQESWAKIWSGRVNDEYKRLVGGRSRGEYLLGLSDVQIGEADSVTDPELLMAIMETREALEEAETEEEVARIREDNQDQMNETFTLLAQAFESADKPDLEKAKNAIVRLKYLENVEDVCREWSPGKRIQIQH